MPEQRERVNRGALRFLAWVLAAMALLLALPAVSAEWVGGETVPGREIHGVVFHDLNQDGEWNCLDTGSDCIPEEPLGGAEVGLWLRTEEEAEPVGTVTTSDDGRFAFGDLRPGEYELVVEPPLGYAVSEEQAEFRRTVTIGAPPQSVEVNVPFILLLGPAPGNHRLHLPLVRR